MARRNPVQSPRPAGSGLAVIYVRVSTEDQALRGYSLPEQVAACRGRATALGFPPERTVVCSDEGVPGEVLSRPGLDQVRELAGNGRMDALICLDPDRLSRDLLNQLLIDRELQRAGVRLEFVNFAYDRNPMGQAFFSFRGIMSELEKALIRERTTRGKVGKARRGGLTHAPGTYGYRFDPATDQLCEDTSPADPAHPADGSKADLVRLLFARAQQGDGAQALSTWLNDLGIPAPRGGSWHRATVLRLLRNETYTGLLHLRRYNAAGQRVNPYLPPAERARRTQRPRAEWLAVAVPALVTRELWASVQEQLDGHRRRRAGQPGTQYLLSGLVSCAHCGLPLRGSLSRGGNGQRYRWYVCAGRSPGVAGQAKCRLPFLRAADLETAVWGQVRQWLLTPMPPEVDGTSDGTDVSAPTGPAGPAGPAGDSPSQAALAASRELTGRHVAALRLGRERLLNLLAQGHLTEAEALERLTQNEAAIDRLAAELAPEPPVLPVPAQFAPTAVVAVTPTAAAAALALTPARIAQALDRLSDEQRQSLVRLLVAEVVVGMPPELVLRARLP